jgi:hypothetical protein
MWENTLRLQLNQVDENYARIMGKLRYAGDLLHIYQAVQK